MSDEQEVQALSKDVKKYFALDNAAKAWWNTRGIRRYERQLEIVAREVNATGKHVLDVGTGRGRFAVQYVKSGARKVTALDISNGMLELARETARLAGVADCIEFLVGDVEEEAFEQECFDIINCMEVYVHLPNPQKTTAAFHRHLKPGGILVANTDVPVTAKWYFMWVNEPLRCVAFYSGLYDLIKSFYFTLLPGFLRKLLNRLFKWPTRPGSPLRFRLGRVLRKEPSTEETVKAMQENPNQRFLRASDAIHRMDRAQFTQILLDGAFEIEKVFREGKWYQLPYGYMVIARKKL
jgi:ubiquinone/menaquinone biosynthesis C-methylase UbiE